MPTPTLRIEANETCFDWLNQLIDDNGVPVCIAIINLNREAIFIRVIPEAFKFFFRETKALQMLYL